MGEINRGDYVSIVTGGTVFGWYYDHGEMYAEVEVGAFPNKK
jgi:hypothetical protein